MKKLTLTKFNDPGHGWVKVRKRMLCDLGIENKISSCSYQNNDRAYLEEDCDWPLFMSFAAQQGFTIRLIDKYTDRQSRIRSMAMYSNLD